MRYLIITFLLVVGPVILFGQDTHYWTQQFGTRSSLLSGAVVGGSKDNSMVYYNPGAIGLIDSSSVSLNASLYQLERYKIISGAGDQVDIKGTEFGNIPLMIAGLINLNLDNRFTFGYMIASPILFEFKSTTRTDGFFDIVDDDESPGLEEYIGQFTIGGRVKETQVSFAVGYKHSGFLGYGASLAFTSRSHDYNKVHLNRLILNTPGSDLNTVTSDLVAVMDYFQIRLHIKAGISYIREDLAVGFTVTTPSLTAHSSATVFGDVTANNINWKDKGRVNVIANDRQESLNARYKTPLSLATGITRTWPGSSINFSAEFFTAIKKYKLIEAAPDAFVRPASDFEELASDDFLTVYEAAKPVFNFAIGYEHDFSKRFGITAGFRTNFSSYDPEVRNNEYRNIQPQLTTWDIYYTTVGFTFKNDRNDLTLGLQFGYGKGSQRQYANLTNPEEGNLLQGVLEDVTASYKSLGFIFGYNYIFRSKGL